MSGGKCLKGSVQDCVSLSKILRITGKINLPAPYGCLFSFSRSTELDCVYNNIIIHSIHG